uniref:Cytochrome n=1 Tax=Lutzomyia longipalpis TaxID=7200 RepID=A0A1B0CKF6_LUTLO
MGVALILLGLTIVTVTIYCYVKRRRILKMVGHLDHFPQWPIIGGVHSFAGKDVAGITATIDYLLKNVKLPAYTWVGPLKLIMVIDDPDDLETLLSDPAALYKPYVYKFFKNDRGLVTSAPHIWKVHRKILSPSFSISVMKHLIPMFNKKITKMVNNLKQLEQGVDVNLLDHLYMCTLDMISSNITADNWCLIIKSLSHTRWFFIASATGVDIDLQDGTNREYVKGVIAGADLVAKRIITVPYHIEWIYRLSSLYNVEKKALKAVNQFLDGIIKLKRTMFDEAADAEEERREELAKLNNEEIETKPKIVINQLFRYWTRGQLDFQDVRDELDVMIYTGSDTSTHLASYTLLMLAIHPNIQEKVVEELQSVFYDETVPFDYDSIKQLTYLEMVIKETLRLYPVIPYIAREVRADVKLKNFTVPSGTMIGVPFIRMNRNPEAFGPNPELFNPDHFLPERVEKRHPNQYMPFSFGPRNCIGITETVDRMLNSVKLPVYTWIGPYQLFLIIDNPEDLEILLSDPNALEKPYIYKFFKKDRGLIAAKANVWKVHRKILSPSFSINMIKTLIPTFNRKAQKMIDKLKNEKEGVDINLLEHFYTCAVDMITSATTEVDIDIDDERNREYIRAVIAGADTIAYRMIQPHYHFDCIYGWSKLYKIEQAAFKVADEFLARIIKLKKDLFDSKADAEEEKREEMAKLRNAEFEQKPKSVINQLFRFWSKGTIGYQDVRDELDIMLYTGSDTSTHLASYTVLMLAMHQDIQEKVVEELKRVFVDPSIPIDYDSIKQLTYLDMVIKETLRLYPVIPYIGRNTTKDIKLKNLTVPSGTMIGIPLMKNNRDPIAFGPNPNLFDPDNFLPERVAKRHPYQYLPFSGGPRNCIGMIYGLFSVRTIVASMMMNFKVKTALRFEDIKLVYNISLRITNENLVKIEPRNFWTKKSGAAAAAPKAGGDAKAADAKGGKGGKKGGKK